jgi:protein ImuB
MVRRFVSVWFRYLKTDWHTLRQPALNDLPFVLRTSFHGRMIITAANELAETNGIRAGMVLADARVIMNDLEVKDDKPELAESILTKLAHWCIRFTPIVGIDLPDGLVFDASGCSHLWGGDLSYVEEITHRLNAIGYRVRVAMADTFVAASAMARFGKSQVVEIGKHVEALRVLPPEALRLQPETIDRLHKLGLHQIHQFINMPRSSLRVRFGPEFISKLDQAVGQEFETIQSICPPEPYQERLPCMEPIVTAAGIEFALNRLLEALCLRLQGEQLGLRKATLKCYRTDGKIEQVEIGTNRPSHHVSHLFKLFEIRLSTIEPSLGIELFVLEAGNVETSLPMQEKMWDRVVSGGLEDEQMSELIDSIAGRFGSACIRRYLPDEHYWPERSCKLAGGLQEKPTTEWRSDKQRPIYLLSKPELIEVTAPIPDYPPMLFRHKGNLHKIVCADGPERIEQEWWLQQGQHRDYYRVEDEEGRRYWLFRLGHYHDLTYQWFLHGYFS